MGKVLGIIAEYNPFHNGHKFHIEESKKITGCDYVVAVISGNFTQRGNTSVVDKWTKTKIAIENGVDLVIELPTIYSISSAENFANGAIRVLNSLGIIDYISFGAETDNKELLEKLADLFVNEPNEYKKILNEKLKLGLSFPQARAKAIDEYFYSNEYSKILENSNNILAIEYLKSLKKINSKIQSIVIRRNKVDYNSLEVIDEIASATGIRNLIQERNLEQIKNVVPESTFAEIEKAIKNEDIIEDLRCYEKEIIYELRNMSISQIKDLPDVSEGLENAIKAASNNCNTLDELIDSLKSKRYTNTRIHRILVCVLLHINKKQMEDSKNVIPYVRVLGFNNKGKELISIISKNVENNLVTSVKRFLESENNGIILKDMLEKDVYASNVYAIECKNNIKANSDYTNQMIIVE